MLALIPGLALMAMSRTPADLVDVYCTPDAKTVIRVEASVVARSADVAFDGANRTLLVSTPEESMVRRFSISGEVLNSWRIPRDFAQWSALFVRGGRLCAIALDKGRSERDSHSEGYTRRQDVILAFPDRATDADYADDIVADMAFDRSLRPTTTRLVHAAMLKARFPTATSRGLNSLSSGAPVTFQYDVAEMRVNARGLADPRWHGRPMCVPSPSHGVMWIMLSSRSKRADRDGPSRP